MVCEDWFERSGLKFIRTSHRASPSRRVHLLVAVQDAGRATNTGLQSVHDEGFAAMNGLATQRLATALRSHCLMQHHEMAATLPALAEVDSLVLGVANPGVTASPVNCLYEGTHANVPQIRHVIT